MKSLIENINGEITILIRIARAVQNMPFGESVALPWCRESFPALDEAMKDWEELL